MLSRILWEYFSCLRSAKLKPRELRELQDKKSRRIVRYAYENVPFYHDSLKSRRITPEDIKGVADLRLLPAITKSDIVANFPDRITSKNVKAVLRISTSGTTGPPTIVLQDAPTVDIRLALRFRRNKFVGGSLWDRLLWIPYFGQDKDSISSNTSLPHKSLFLNRSFQFLFESYTGKRTALRQATLPLGRDNMKELAEALVALNPDVIVSRPSYLSRIGNILASRSSKLNTKRLILEGETLSKGTRQDLEKMYHCDVFDNYGTQEFGGFGNECSKNCGIHLWSDYYAFEVLKDGQPVADGEKGEIAVTSYQNRVMPLLRYRVGDIVQMEDDGAEVCQCGSSLPRLRKVEGRINDGLALGEGLNVPPGEVVDYLESAVGLRNFQIVQKDYQVLLVKLQERDMNDMVVHSLLDYLHKLLGHETKIDITMWKEEDMPMKYRAIVSEVETVFPSD